MTSKKQQVHKVYCITMINRALIRIRATQSLYACLQQGEKDVIEVKKELSHSLEKTYELYLSYFSLLIDLREAFLARTEQRKRRHLATQEDLSPNLRFANNRVIKRIASSSTLETARENSFFSWSNHPDFLKGILDYILQSDIYTQYLTTEDNFENDLLFCRQLCKQILFEDQELHDLLEEESIYWSTAFDIVESFVLKTLKLIREDSSEEELFIPMFKEEEDSDFAYTVLATAFVHQDKYKKLIEAQSIRWDSERIAFLDMAIMLLALSEIESMPLIPISVTLNEYVEIGKLYSTPKSASFINAVLDSIAQEQKGDKQIEKTTQE